MSLRTLTLKESDVFRATFFNLAADHVQSSSIVPRNKYKSNVSKVQRRIITEIRWVSMRVKELRSLLRVETTRMVLY